MSFAESSTRLKLDSVSLDFLAEEPVQPFELNKFRGPFAVDLETHAKQQAWFLRPFFDYGRRIHLSRVFCLRPEQ